MKWTINQFIIKLSVIIYFKGKGEVDDSKLLHQHE